MQENKMKAAGKKVKDGEYDGSCSNILGGSQLNNSENLDVSYEDLKHSFFQGTIGIIRWTQRCMEVRNYYWFLDSNAIIFMEGEKEDKEIKPLRLGNEKHMTTSFGHLLNSWDDFQKIRAMKISSKDLDSKCQ